jgi:dGTPase
MLSISTCRAFRRLAGKTQVIHAPRHDHVATRLTHSLDVACIASQLARSLSPASGEGGEVDLERVEAIALAHDVGHPPFGHAGEQVLTRLSTDAGLGSFHHASFGVRVLSKLDPPCGGVPDAVLEGVLAHSKGREGAVFLGSALPIEARIVRAADLYAYASGDLDDGFRLGVFTASELPPRARRVLGETGRRVRATLVARTLVAKELRLDDEAEGALRDLRAFLYQRFYCGPPTVAQTSFAREVLTRLFRRFERDLAATLAAVGWSRREEERPSMRDALDAIGCMTDRFAITAAA